MALKFNSRNRTLSSDSSGFIKKIQCPLNKQWDELQLVDASDEDGSDFSGVIEERHRHCFSCQKNVFNLDGLSEAQIEAAIMANPYICIHATLPHPSIVYEETDPFANAGVAEFLAYKNDVSDPPREVLSSQASCAKVEKAYLNHGLKEVKTARSLAALNLAVKQGLKIQLVQLDADNSLHRSFHLVEYDDGTYGEVVDYRTIIMPKFQNKPIVASHPFSQYRYCFDNPWAAYLLPVDVEEGDQVFVWDVIQDQVKKQMNHGGSFRQQQCIATWVGGELVIPTVEPEVWIG